MLLSGSMKPEKTKGRHANQGEGDRVSARRYNKAARKFASSGKVAPAARAAERHVESAPAEAARAEREAKRGPKSRSAPANGLIAKGRSVVERLRPLVGRTVGKLRDKLRRK